MRATTALCAWSAVAAFVPRPISYSPFLISRATASPDTTTTISATQVPSTGVEQGTCTSSSASASRRVTAPVVLVSSDAAILESFAQHLCANTNSPVLDLSDVAKQDGSRGVEQALAGRSKSNAVLVCPANPCLDHPEVRTLLADHPLTVQLAIAGEDKDVRARCEKASRYTVVVNCGGNATEEDNTYAKEDLARLVAFARKPKPSKEDIALNMGKNTFFLSLTFPDFASHVDLLPNLLDGVDAMELRVDLLADHDPYSVLNQLSILRRHTGYLPVVFTIRSKGQCGAFPDDPDSLFRLARWGLRAGAEVMDVESNWPMRYRKALLEAARKGYPGAVLVGSYHVVGRKITEKQARQLFLECYHDGTVDAVKVQDIVALDKLHLSRCEGY